MGPFRPAKTAHEALRRTLGGSLTAAWFCWTLSTHHLFRPGSIMVRLPHKLLRKINFERLSVPQREMANTVVRSAAQAQRRSPQHRPLPQDVDRGHRYTLAQRIQCLTLLAEGFSPATVEQRTGVKERQQRNIRKEAFSRTTTEETGDGSMDKSMERPTTDTDTGLDRAYYASCAGGYTLGRR